MLRSCPLYGGKVNAAQVDSLLSDALGLQVPRDNIADLLCPSLTYYSPARPVACRALVTKHTDPSILTTAPVLTTAGAARRDFLATALNVTVVTACYRSCSTTFWTT